MSASIIAIIFACFWLIGGLLLRGIYCGWSGTTALAAIMVL